MNILLILGSVSVLCLWGVCWIFLIRRGISVVEHRASCRGSVAIFLGAHGVLLLMGVYGALHSGDFSAAWRDVLLVAWGILLSWFLCFHYGWVPPLCFRLSVGQECGTTPGEDARSSFRQRRRIRVGSFIFVVVAAAVALIYSFGNRILESKVNRSLLMQEEPRASESITP